MQKDNNIIRFQIAFFEGNIGNINIIGYFFYFVDYKSNIKISSRVDAQPVNTAAHNSILFYTL